MLSAAASSARPRPANCHWIECQLLRRACSKRSAASQAAAYHLLLLPVLSQAPTEPLLQAEVGEAPARACAFKPGQRRNAGGKDAIASPDKQSIAASLATLVLTLPALRECR